MTELKPCPFCGSDKVFIAKADETHPLPAIVCEMWLVAVLNPPDEKTLTEMWNRRVNED